MVNPLHNTLSIEICADADEAIERNFNWTKSDPPVKPIEVKKVVVVRSGTAEGNPTVDFLMEDETGQRFVFMITGRLLKSIPC